MAPAVFTFAFGYDPNGNRTSATLSIGSTSAPPVAYGYDQANRLTSALAVTHRYDGDGLRVTKGPSAFTWDISSAVPRVLVDAATAYVTGPGGLPLQAIGASGPVTYFHGDQLGSTRALTDAAGAVVATYTYEPYGTTHTATGPAAAANPFRYAGEYRDDETGFIYLRARHYDPSTAVFTSRDPIEAITRQPYAYVSNSPLNAIDPCGLHHESGATTQAGVASSRLSMGGLAGANANISPAITPGPCQPSVMAAEEGEGPEQVGEQSGRYTESELKEAEQALRRNQGFRRWFHREYKKDVGPGVGARTNPDLDRDLLRDAFEEWIEQGRPGG